MGFFDKAIKNVFKSPLGKAALLGAGAYFGGPGIMSALGKVGASPFIMGAKGALGKAAAMPLLTKPLTSAATSYGLARLMRARNPEKAALYGALTTLPFLFSGANKEALALAEAGFEGAGGKKASMLDVLLNRNVSMPGIKDIATSGSQYRIPFTMDDINPAYGKGFDMSTRSMPVTGANKINFPGYNVGDFAPQQVNNFDPINKSLLDSLQKEGRFLDKKIGDLIPRSEIMRENVLAQLNDPSITAQKYAAASQRQPNLFSNMISGESMGAGENLNYFMKPPATGEETAKTGLAALLPKTDFNILNAMVPSLAGVYGARETDAQAWERIKKQRKQQLAFMYGVDPEDIEGEMDNPYYNIKPPALDFKYANKGGVMDLDMGGDISGPGTGTSDSINAKVSDGEFIFTEQAVRNFGGGDRQKGAQRMYAMMNQLDPRSETPQEGMV